MNRRDFLSITGATGLISTAGCTSVLSESANFEIERLDHDESVGYEETINVEATISNTGDEEGEEEIVFRIGENTIDIQRVTIEGSGNTTLSFSAENELYDSGSHTLTISTPHDEYNAVTHVSEPEPAAFLLKSIDAPMTVSHNDSVSFDLTISNTGHIDSEQSIVLSIDGEDVVSENVSISGGDEKDITVFVPSGEIFNGTYEIQVSTEDDETTTTIQVDNPNPYGKDTLIVGLEQRTPARHDIQEIVEDALSYWEANSELYAGYPIEYQYRSNASDPDVQIVLVEDIEQCGEHTGEIAGCAPLVRDRAPNTAEIRIVDGYRKEWMTTTLKHELGHTLGLDHSDEPADIMSNDIEDRIPNYADRQAGIDFYTDSFEPYSDGRDAWEDSMIAWENQNYAETESAAVDAHNYLLDAQRKVGGARSVAKDLNEDTAYRRVNEAHTYIELFRLAADSAIEMAREAQQTFGDPEPHRQEANSYLDESNTYSLTDPVDVVRAFGFPVDR